MCPSLLLIVLGEMFQDSLLHVFTFWQLWFSALVEGGQPLLAMLWHLAQIDMHFQFELCTDRSALGLQSCFFKKGPCLILPWWCSIAHDRAFLFAFCHATAVNLAGTRALADPGWSHPHFFVSQFRYSYITLAKAQRISDVAEDTTFYFRKNPAIFCLRQLRAEELSAAEAQCGSSEFIWKLTAESVPLLDCKISESDTLSISSLAAAPCF